MNRPENALMPKTGWVITSGHAGHREPCIGVFEALGIAPKVIDVTPRAPWKFLAPYGPAAHHPDVKQPWPELLIVSGRQSIPYAKAIKRKSRGNTFVAVLQNPVAAVSKFDLVWVNKHDALAGPNVIRTVTTPSRVNETRLQADAETLRIRAPQLTDKVLGVIVGGSSRFYSFGEAQAAALARDLRNFADRHGYSVAVTPSRRTGRKNTDLIRAGLSDVASWVWDGSGENPYFGILGLADRLLVTCDSVNMLGEAAFTGKPLNAYRLPGESPKIESFHADLIDHGAMRWFDGACVDWSYPRLDATKFVADEVVGRYLQHRNQPA